MPKQDHALIAAGLVRRWEDCIAPHDLPRWAEEAALTLRALVGQRRAPVEEDGGNGKVLVVRATVYVLNSAGVNRWSAQVQPGFDDNDQRVSDAECQTIARRMAAALAAPPMAGDHQAGDGWVSVEQQVPDMYEDVLVHPRPTDYCCEAHLTRSGWQYSSYEQYNGHVTSPCTVTHWKRLGAPGAAAAGQDAERLERIRKAIDGYHLALDTRQHGGVAMDRAFNIIADAMGMPWVPGAAARAAQAQGGANG